MATVAYASTGKAKGWFFRFLVVQQWGRRGRRVRRGVVWNPRDGRDSERVRRRYNDATAVDRRGVDRARARGGRSCAVHSSWQHPLRRPSSWQPQHSAVTRAVRNPRGPLPLSGLPVRPSAPDANGHVVVSFLTSDNQTLFPSFPLAVTLLADLTNREFSIFSISSYGNICSQSEFLVELLNLGL